jgi:hypothetical protein
MTTLPPNSFEAEDTSGKFVTVLWGEVVEQVEDSLKTEGAPYSSDGYTYKTVDGKQVVRVAPGRYEIRSGGDGIPLTGVGPEDQKTFKS